MNKLLENTVIENFVLSKGKYIIKGDVTISSFLVKNDFEITFYLENGASFTFSDAVLLNDKKGSITFISTNHTNLSFHLGIQSLSNNNLEIKNIINGDYNKSEIKIRIISEEGSTILLKTEGNLKEKTKENDFLEDIKYLNEYPGSITCFPNLLVFSSQSIANHNMTVGTINEEELFYLESRGLQKEKAKKIIRENFIHCIK